MSDYATEIVAARMQAVNAKLTARMQEITNQTGVKFSDLFTQRLAQAVQVESKSNDTTDTVADTEASADTVDVLTEELEQTLSSYTRNDYDSLITDAAIKHGLTPALVRAVVWAESNFDSSAVSKSGAMGLMQLMPDVAALLGVSDALDAEENVNAGTYLLSEKIKKYGGDVRLALASYNCGDGGLSTRGIDDLNDSEQFSRLPQETQNYLQRVEGYLESVGVNIGDL